MELWENLSFDILKDIYNGKLYVEEWKKVIGFEGLYEISSFGRIKAVLKTVKAPESMGGTITRNPKIIKQGRTSNGYLKSSLLKEGNKKTFSLHRLVGIHFIPNINNLPQINHIEGNQKDNRFWMLEWSTSSDNLKHAYRNGLARQDGEFHATKKLNWIKVREIRNLHKQGIPTKELSKKFGIHSGHINGIIANIYW